MKKFNKFSKWIYLAISVFITGALVVGTEVVRSYDSIIAGALNAANNTTTGGNTTTNDGVETLGSALCAELIEEGAVLLKNKEIENGTNSLPLHSRKKALNIFGYGATDEGWLQYGIGSGSTKPQSNKSVNLLDAFDASPYSYNKEIFEAYEQLNWPNKLTGTSSDTKKAHVYYQYEASRTWYENQPDLLENAKKYSDTAIFVIRRVSGENTRTDSNSKEAVPAEQTLYTDGSSTAKKVTDRTYLQTTEVEEGVIDMLSENFKNVIVILNTSNAMFLDTINDKDDRVDSILYVGITGECGAEAIPDLLWGKVNPSGHLSDTFPINPKADPAFANRNDYSTPVFQESIYFGYKWYETADSTGFWNTQFSKNNFGISSYEEAVFRPFGYGMSYTNFDWNIESIKVNNNEVTDGYVISDNSKIDITVKVTNVGNVAGKEVVQLYYTPPYVKGEIEKASVNLLDFDKTVSLKPNETMNLTLSFTPYDMASFDSYDVNNNGFSGYELDPGAYEISLRSDAHNVKNDLKLTLNIGENGIKFENDPVTGVKVVPQFSGESAYKGVPIDGKGFIGNNGEGVNYLTRNNFEGTFALTKTSGKIEANSSIASTAATSSAKDLHNFTEMPTTGVESNLRLVTREDGSFATKNDLTGQSSAKLKMNEDLIKELDDYNNPKWDTLLNQMSLDEYVNFVCYAGFKTYYSTSIGKPQTRDIDGPAGFNGAYSTLPAIDEKWTSYPCETIIACTYSKRLAFNLGCCLGAEAQSEKVPVNGIYGPGANLHRSPFGSRNYEYFSEDRVLTGVMASNEITGAKINGLYMYMKHFVADEMGYNPRNTTTWMTEQSLREEYCRPFEIAVKYGEANAIMTSFNKIGNIFTGHAYPLCTTMLREEWGFNGIVLTDYYTGADDSMNAIRCIAAGNDAILNPKTTYASGRTPVKTDVTDMNLARIATKNIVYTYVNTYAYSMTHEIDDDKYKVEVGVVSTASPKSGVPEFLTGVTISLGIVFLAFNLLNFLRPVVVNEDGTLSYTDKEIKIRKQVSRYLPLTLGLTSIVLSVIAKSLLANSFFVNFFTGLMSDIGMSFAQFGFGVVMNVVVYVGLLAFIGVAALFVMKLIKKREIGTIVNFSSLLFVIFTTLMFLGTLLFALSTGSILKNLTDLIFILFVGISSITALILSIINVVKEDLLNNKKQ